MIPKTMGHSACESSSIARVNPLLEASKITLGNAMMRAEWDQAE